MDLGQDLLGDLYAVAESGARWPRLLDGLRRTVGMRSAVAQVLESNHVQSRQLWCARDPRSQADAPRHDRFINTAGNPRFDAGRRHDGVGGVGSDVRSFGAAPQSWADLRQRLDRGGLGAALWLTFPIAAERDFTLILHRAPGDLRDVSPEEETYLLALLPHLMRAVRLGAGRGPAGVEADAFRATLDRLSNAVLLLGADQRVTWSNAAAERLLHRVGSLRLVAGRLDCTEAGDGLRMRQALAAVRAARLPTATLAIGRWGATPLHLRIEPLAAAVAGEGADRDQPVALFLSEPDAAQALDPVVLSALFGLTRAEAQLAAAIGAGVTLADHAAARGVAIGTARIQLKQVLAKTASGRQSELVRRLCHSLADVAH